MSKVYYLKITTNNENTLLNDDTRLLSAMRDAAMDIAAGDYSGNYQTEFAEVEVRELPFPVNS